MCFVWNVLGEDEATFPEPKRQFAFRRLREKNAEESRMQTRTLRWAKITGWAGVASVIMTVVFGIASIVVSILLAR
jgi:hypothetical protein